MLQHALGLSAVDAAAVAAFTISLGTSNAYVAAVSRLGCALARDGWLPGRLAHRSGSGVPSGGVWLVGGIGLSASWAAGWGTQQIVFVPATLVAGVYVLGTAAAVRITQGGQRRVALRALLLTALALPFAGWHLVLLPLVAVLALGYRVTAHRFTVAPSSRPPKG